MLQHPLLNSLFNENALTPSKQLQMVRSHLRGAKLEPYIVVVVPPAGLLMREVDVETFYHDTYLLSHIAVIDWQNPDAPLLTMNGGNWMVNITETQVIPGQNFPTASAAAVNITSSRVWTPGLTNLRFNATFLILEVDGLLLTNSTPRRLSIFASPSISVPLEGSSEVHIWSRSTTEPTQQKQPSVAAVEIDEVAATPRQIRNPASNLGRTKTQRDQNMAKVDYCLACLQQDVASAKELAERFHSAVYGTREALLESGAVFKDITSHEKCAENEFTLRTIYEYAETRLARFVLKKLDDLLDRERKDVPFQQVQSELRSLDITQVDVPGLNSVNIDVYERAVAKAAETLGKLGSTRDSDSMSAVFLQSLNELADPHLGTVSADTLLGLFMLTVLRCPSDSAAIIERNLYFVVNFSYRAAEQSHAHLSAGRLSYTLMVVESVLLQLRMERKRLGPLAQLNTKVWHAVETNDRSQLENLFEEDAGAFQSRKAGKSALFLAVEQDKIRYKTSLEGKSLQEDDVPENDVNSSMKSSILAFLLSAFPQTFTREFVLKDRDMEGRTLLMAVLFDRNLTALILDLIGNDSEYYIASDRQGRSVAHLLHGGVITTVLKKAGHLLNWVQRDHVSQDTPLLALARRGLLDHIVQYCENFYDHIDTNGDSLLHIAVNSAPDTLIKLLTIPSCDVNWVNKSRCTPLMKAILESSIELLLQAGANVWHFDVSNTEQTSSPSLRRSLASRDSASPFIQTSHRPDERLLFQPASTLIGVRKFDDFEALYVQLRTASRLSWLPRLEWIYSKLKDAGISHHFYGAFLWDDTFRVGFWLRMINHHGTFGNCSQLLEFSSNTGASEVSTAELPVSSSQAALDHEEATSIASFCRFSIEQLNTLEAALKRFTRNYLAVQEAHDKTSTLSAVSYRELRSLGTLLNVAFQPVQPESVASSLQRETTVVFDQLVKSTGDLQHDLVRPIALVQELDAAKTQLVDGREKLQALADSNNPPSWLPRLESKRVMEIQNLEEGVASSRKLILQLEKGIRESHFLLASELSAFNSFQEEEILEQLDKYARDRLQAARDSLRRLKYGFMPRFRA